MMPLLRAPARPLNLAVIGTATVPMDALEKVLGKVAVRVWEAFDYRRDRSTGLSRATAETIRKHLAKGDLSLTKWQVHRAFKRLAAFGILRHVGRQNFGTQRHHAHVVFGWVRGKYALVPAAVEAKISGYVGRGGKRDGAGRKSKRLDVTAPATGIKVARTPAIKVARQGRDHTNTETLGSSGSLSGNLQMRFADPAGADASGGRSGREAVEASPPPAPDEPVFSGLIEITGIETAPAAEPAAPPPPAPAPRAPAAPTPGVPRGLAPRPLPRAPERNHGAENTPAPGHWPRELGTLLGTFTPGPPPRRVSFAFLVEQGLVPEAPSTMGLTSPVLPDPPLLDADDPLDQQVVYCAQLYREIVTAKTGNAPWALHLIEKGKVQLPRRGEKANPKHAETLWNLRRMHEGVPRLQELEIPPAAWIAWSVDKWLAAVKRGRKASKVPPRWVFNAERIHERRGWFKRDSSRYMGGQSLLGPKHRDLLQRYHRLRMAVGMANTDDPATVRTLVDEHFPEGYDVALAEAKVESERVQANINRKVELGEYVWENSSRLRPTAPPPTARPRAAR